MANRPAAISVIVRTRSDASPAPAVASLRASAEHTGVPVQIVLVDADAAATPEAPADADLTIDAFPLDSAYLRNRGLEVATAPIVAFVDPDLELAREWASVVVGSFAREPRLGAAVGPIAPSGAVPRRARFDPGANSAFDRAALIAVGGFDRDFGGAGHAPGVEVDDALLRLADRAHPHVREPRMLASRPDESAAARREHDPVLVARLARRHRSVRPVVAHLRHLRALSVARGAAARLRDDDSAPASALLERLPEPFRTRLAEAEVVPVGSSYRAKTHFRFRIGAELVLHLYVNPSARLRRALAERERIRAGAAVDGIPRLHDSVAATDALWVLEDAVPGRPPRPEDVGTWFPAVADWAVALAGPPGRALDESEHWRHHRREALDVAADAGLAGVTGRCFDLASRLPSRHMHGDFQRRNVMIAGERIGLVDWEGAWVEGIPGLDLVFLALLARADRPEASLLPLLASGGDAPWAPVRSRLERLDLAAGELRTVLVVMLATWATAERRRLARLGAPPVQPVWEPLFRRLAPSLVA
ncbi:MAG: hypothetical protein ICV74_06270 [Thermoleophilia bacterium]|nr:hypothetical protein [Thermoleophilia bacterium]